jgi:hypothetical protein
MFPAEKEGRLNRNECAWGVVAVRCWLGKDTAEVEIKLSTGSRMGHRIFQKEGFW